MLNLIYATAPLWVCITTDFWMLTNPWDHFTVQVTYFSQSQCNSLKTLFRIDYQILIPELNDPWLLVFHFVFLSYLQGFDFNVLYLIKVSAAVYRNFTKKRNMEWIKGCGVDFYVINNCCCLNSCITGMSNWASKRQKLLCVRVSDNI